MGRLNPNADRSNVGSSTICKLCYNNLRLCPPAEEVITTVAVAIARDSEPDKAKNPSAQEVAAPTDAKSPPVRKQAAPTEASNSSPPAPARVSSVINLSTTKKRTQTTSLGGKSTDKSGNKRVATNRLATGRKRYTSQEKLHILDEIARKETTQTAVCKEYGCEKTSVRRWKNERAKLEEAVAEEGRANMKANLKNDPLRRVKDGVRAFYELNNTMPKDLKIPITQNVISIKALAIRDRLVESHNESPFLSEHALQHMVDFTGSLSWASKVAKASGWKSRALHGEAGSVDVEADTLCQLKPDANEAEEEDADDEIEDAGPKEPISYDAMNEWAAQLKAISVKIAASGEDYAAAAMSVSDASENVRSAFRKANNKKKASKRDVARQHKIGAFFKK